MMEKTTATVRKITASDGMMLTNGQVCGKEIFLGVNDSADNWYEITEEEYKELAEEVPAEEALMELMEVLA